MTFLLDENISYRLAPVLWSEGAAVQSVEEVGLRGKSDEEVLKFVGQKGWYLVSSDPKIARRPELVAIIHAHKVGAFFFTGKADRGLMGWAKVCVNRWEEIVEFARMTSTPFLAKVPDRGAIKQWRPKRRRTRRRKR